MREDAAYQLGEKGSSQGLFPLIHALRDEYPPVRQEAAEALGKLGNPEAVKPLIAALGDPDDFFVKKAAEALTKLKDPTTLPMLMAKIRSRENDREKRGAIVALGTVGDRAASDELIAILNDRTSPFRLEAIAALASMRESAAVAPITAFLQDESAIKKDDSRLPFDNPRRMVIDCLGRLGKPAVEPLMSLLESPDSETREAAAEALGNTEDPAAVKPLIEFLMHHEGRARLSAMQGLVSLGSLSVPSLTLTAGNADWRIATQSVLGLCTINANLAVTKSDFARSWVPGFADLSYWSKAKDLCAAEPKSRAETAAGLRREAESMTFNLDFFIPFLVELLDDHTPLEWVPLGQLYEESRARGWVKQTTPAKEAALALAMIITKERSYASSNRELRKAVTGMDGDPSKWKDWWAQEQVKYLETIRQREERSRIRIKSEVEKRK